jgi:hypothetical protein
MSIATITFGDILLIFIPYRYPGDRAGVIKLAQLWHINTSFARTDRRQGEKLTLKIKNQRAVGEGEDRFRDEPLMVRGRLGWEKMRDGGGFFAALRMTGV